MTRNFSDICITTGDVLKTREFYEAVFEGKAEGDEWHSTMTAAGLTFSFDSAPNLQNMDAFRYVKDGGTGDIIIGFDVDDVDAEYARVTALRAEALNVPTTHPWGVRSFQFKDPEGNILNFRSLPK